MELGSYGCFHDRIADGLLLGRPRLAKTYFRQLIEGIEYLHSKDISHLNLSAEQLLIGEDYMLKIIDFSKAWKKSDKKYLS